MTETEALISEILEERLRPLIERIEVLEKIQKIGEKSEQPPLPETITLIEDENDDDNHYYSD